MVNGKLALRATQDNHRGLVGAYSRNQLRVFLGSLRQWIDV